MNKVYAVGKLYLPDDVDLESLKYFKTEGDAEVYYFDQICRGGFKACQTLAIFMIIDNMIVSATGLKPFNLEMKVGPVGPIEYTDYLTV